MQLFQCSTLPIQTGSLLPSYWLTCVVEGLEKKNAQIAAGGKWFVFCR